MTRERERALFLGKGGALLLRSEYERARPGSGTSSEEQGVRD